MYNYVPLYVIILIFATVVFFGVREMSALQRDILEPARRMEAKISLGESVEEDYRMIGEKFSRHDTVLNMYINHSVYSNIVICLTEIGNDIEYDRRAELECDVKRLVYYLEDIIDGEKIKINNIF